MITELKHGESNISVDGDIISVIAIGAFNKAGIVNTIEQLESVIKSFDQKKFKLLFDYSRIEGGTPDVFTKINECNIWLNNQNMVAKAVVINSRAHLSILEKRAPARKVQKTKNFEDITTALIWLKSQ